MSPSASKQSQILALSGGVGGAKLILGLARVMPADELMVMANTADDFEHFGLRICPDLDTVTYTLAGLANQELGWGRAGETWNFMSVLGVLGAEDWFNLGDSDLALHVARSERLKKGESLSQIAADIAKRLGIAVALVPMSDDPVATIVETARGDLPFQHYFVRDRCEPAVTGFRFEGLATAGGNAQVLSELAAGNITAVVIAPSNPFVSVDPILGLADLRAALSVSSAPLIAVSPIVGGIAIKGPAAKMMVELGMPATAVAVAQHYQRKYPGLLSGFVIDDSDAGLADEIRSLGLAVLVTPTIMADLNDREHLARACLSFADQLKTGTVLS